LRVISKRISVTTFVAAFVESSGFSAKATTKVATKALNSHPLRQFDPAVNPHSRFPEQDDAVCIGSFGHVVHTPAVGGFGELLVVDQNQERLQTCCYAAGQDGFLESGLAGMNFAHLKGNVAAGFQNAIQLTKDPGHDGLPLLEFCRGREFYLVGIQAKEPAPKPVVRGVLHDVEKGR
jgi:hypothetical protein